MRIAILAFVVLAACGADGPPVAPTSKSAAVVSISGDARVGVVYEE